MGIKKILAILPLCAVILAAGCTARERDVNVSAAASPEISQEEPAAAPALPQRAPETPLPPDKNTGQSITADETDTQAENNGAADEPAQPVLEEAPDIDSLSAAKVKWGASPRMNADGRPEESAGLQQKYGGMGALFLAPNNNKIYLTFDEGYENSYTPDILDTLREKKVSAVFFITHQYARTQPELVRRMVEEGHILGNHSTAHKSFPALSHEEAAEDIMTLHNYVKANYGYTMSLFRPPMGEFSEQTLALARSVGYTTVLWSFAYADWDRDNQPISIQALDTINKRAHNGAVMLLHAVSKTNADILNEVIDTLRGRGFEFARLDWL